MKTLLMFLAAALLFVIVGCEEQSVEPIVAANPPKAAAPTLQKIVINERLDVKTPEGFTGFVDVVGEINYRMIKAELALGKELPVPKKTVYNTIIGGEGVVTLLPATGFAKANTYRFSGDMMMVLEEGTENIEVTFRIEDATWSGAHYHVGFIVGNGTLSKYTSRIELFPDMSQ
jgi:hypothetical protein